ncbi:hypothetical protein HYT92_01175 [Candidatus Pacearchaeota archaeon]|nr:hypothetical protein [Candidatus Pacearchaeota archaeon]
MKAKYFKLGLTAAVLSLFAILLDFIAHKLLFEPAYPEFLPEIFSYFAAKFIVIFLVYFLFMYILAYSKSKLSESRILRPVVIAFVAMLVFATYYYFYPSNTNPATLSFSFFPFMGLNHFLDILISALLVESVAMRGEKEKTGKKRKR